MIEVESETLIRSSREAVWRHLTRVSEWPRWYPGLHGVDARESITGADYAWRSSGQLGRMLYRSRNQVTEYQLLRSIALDSDRRPWIRSLQTRIQIEPEGPNCRVRVTMMAVPGFGLIGRLLLRGTLRRRLAKESASVCDRLKQYVEHTLPHH